MKILALDLGKYKTVGCDYVAESGEYGFATIATHPRALHDLIVDREPDRVVIEICSIAGWVGDLVRSLGIELQVANTADERWRWRKVKQKNDRNDALKAAQLSAVEDRRRLVADRTRFSNRLTALLKGYFPQVLDWFEDIRTIVVCDFLDSLAPALSRAASQTIHHQPVPALSSLHQQLNQSAPPARD